MNIKILILTTLFLFVICNNVSADYVYAFVPNSNEGNSISELNITNITRISEITRHYTHNVSRQIADPSRTAIDLNGNVWIGNRNLNTLIKIGNYGLGKCVDKNNNGVIDTSKDLNNNGVIDTNEMVSFNDDECILKVVVFGNIIQYIGNREGVRCVCVDKNNNIYAGMFGQKKVYYLSNEGYTLKEIDLTPYNCGPYGCLVDDENNVWISCEVNERLVKYNPKTNNISYINTGVYALSLTPKGDEGKIVFGDYSNRRVKKVYSNLSYVFDVYNALLADIRGIVTDRFGNIYVVSSYYSRINKLDKYGNYIGNYPTCYTPTGIGIDKNENILVACLNSCVYAHNISNLNVISSLCFGTGHYVYSDWTGYFIRSIEQKYNYTLRTIFCNSSAYFIGSDEEGGCLFFSYILLAIVLSFVGVTLHYLSINLGIEIHKSKHFLSAIISVMIISILTFLGLIDILTSIIVIFLIVGLLSIYKGVI